jgi:phosphate transport system protein
MLNKSLNTVDRLDLLFTVQVMRQSEMVNEEFRTIMRNLITFMIALLP